jgi:hypothetical protein
MAHAPETPARYVCEHCQVIHAGTPVHEGGGEHSFTPPDVCGACGETAFVRFAEWVHHHD